MGKEIAARTVVMRGAPTVGCRLWAPIDVLKCTLPNPLKPDNAIPVQRSVWGSDSAAPAVIHRDAEDN